MSTSGLPLALASVAALAAASAWRRRGSHNAGSLPYGLRFLEHYLGASHRGLAAYFPETAKGMLKPRRGEAWFDADGMHYLGDTDGTMVPIDADDLEPMPENIFYPDKFSALVEAVEAGDNPGVYPGYADLTVEDGRLVAQVRDGNHRTFAPIAAGGTRSWVMMSDNTRQDLDRRTPGSEALYRAVRAAQRAAGAPLFTRRSAGKVKGPTAELRRLAALERRRIELEGLEDTHYRAMLRRWGRVEETGHPLFDQLERAQLFWRLRLSELRAAHGAAWLDEHLFDTPEHDAAARVTQARSALFSELYDLRKALGLKVGERLDPATLKPVRD